MKENIMNWYLRFDLFGENVAVANVINKSGHW